MPEPPPADLLPKRVLLMAMLLAKLTQMRRAGVLFHPASLERPARFATDPAAMVTLTTTCQLAEAGFWMEGGFFPDANANLVAFSSGEIMALAEKAETYLLDCVRHAARLATQIAECEQVDPLAGWPAED